MPVQVLFRYALSLVVLLKARIKAKEFANARHFWSAVTCMCHHEEGIATQLRTRAFALLLGGPHRLWARPLAPFGVLSKRCLTRAALRGYMLAATFEADTPRVAEAGAGDGAGAGSVSPELMAATSEALVKGTPVGTASLPRTLYCLRPPCHSRCYIPRVSS
jgi:hypothetical protein